MKLDTRAIIIGIEGTELKQEEFELFRDLKPAGFILFQRNCKSVEQLKKLIVDLRTAIIKPDCPILIDQEGGDVSRLKSPVWDEFPPAKLFGEIYKKNKDAGLEAARLNAFLMGIELTEMGITVNCAPVVDLPSEDCHGFLSDSRTYGNSVEQVVELGNAVAQGLMDSGVTPVFKHIPGHGRCNVDSHKDLPVVDETISTLTKTDFLVFKDLCEMGWYDKAWAMAAHVIYSSIDDENTATMSSKVIHDIIRDEITFDGLLIADDISMNALSGSIEEKVKQTIDAGMDLTLHCNGDFWEMEEALLNCPMISNEAMQRLIKAEEARNLEMMSIYDVDEIERRLNDILNRYS